MRKLTKLLNRFGLYTRARYIAQTQHVSRITKDEAMKTAAQQVLSLIVGKYRGRYKVDMQSNTVTIEVGMHEIEQLAKEQL